MKLTELQKHGVNISIYHVLTWEYYLDNDKRGVFKTVELVKECKLSVYKQNFKNAFNRSKKALIIQKFANQLAETDRKVFFAIIHNDFDRVKHYVLNKKMNYVANN